MNNTILIFHFFIQFLINFMDEKGLKKHPFISNKLKYLLNTFFDALIEQMNKYVKGDDFFKIGEFTLENLDNTHKGALEIEEYFKVSFSLYDKPVDIQNAFINEYSELLKKYELNQKSL